MAKSYQDRLGLNLKSKDKIIKECNEFSEKEKELNSTAKHFYFNSKKYPLIDADEIDRKIRTTLRIKI